MSWTAATFFLYLAAMVAVGIVTSRRSSRSVEEFYLGGRRMREFVVALSAVVSGRSSWLVLGVSGLALTSGISAVWALPGYIVCELFLLLYFGKRLRRFTGAHGHVTLPDYLESRLGDRTRLVRVAAVLMILFFFTGYISAQLYAGQKTFQSVFDLGALEGMLLISVIVALYTILGGYVAVAITDVIQAVLMIVGLVVLPAWAAWRLGGVAEVFAALPATHLDPWAFGIGASLALVGIGLGSPGQPHILARLMSIDDPRRLRMAALVGTVWNVLMGWGAVMIGVVGKACLEQQALLAEEYLRGADSELLFIELSKAVFHPALAGLMVAALVAAIMSTVDSQLLVAASAIARDLYEKLIVGDRARSERHLVVVNRATVAVLVLSAAVIGTLAQQLPGFQRIFNYVLVAWGALGAAFGPVLVASLYWKRTTASGAVASILTGGIGAMAWKVLVVSGLGDRLKTAGLSFFAKEWVTAFIAASLVLVVVSLLTAPPPEAEAMIAGMRPRYRRGRREPEGAGG